MKKTCPLVNLLGVSVFRVGANDHSHIFAAVKKYSALFFISVYFFHSMGLAELFKLNNLVAHFHKTQQDNRSVSFVGFLVMHYVTDDMNNKDNEEDNQLPFKSPVVAGSAASSAVAPVQIATYNFHSLLSIKYNFSAYTEPFLPTDHLASVWHPPQVA